MGGDSGHLHLLLRAGGKVITRTGKIFDQVSEDLILIVFFLTLLQIGISFTVKIHCNRRECRQDTPHTWFFPWLKSLTSSRLYRPQKIGPIAMSSMFAPAHSSSSSCSHPTPLTLTSSPLTTSSRPTSQITLSDQHTTSKITQKRGGWPFGQNTTSHRLWAQRDRHFWWVRGYSFTLPGLECRHYLRPWRNDAESTDAEIDDEHTRYALALPLFSHPIWDKPITPTQKICLVVYSQFLQAQCNPSLGWHKNACLAKSLMTVRSGSFWQGTARGRKILNPETWVQSGWCRKPNSCTE